MTSPDDFSQNIIARMSISPTPSQAKAIMGFAKMMLTTRERPTMVVNGYAGTGKTSVLKAFCDTLDYMRIPIVLMAPTGRAAKVLSLATGRKAQTIHRTIYRQESAGADSFANGYNKWKGGVFIVDEASMIGNEYVGLGAYSVFSDCRLLSDLIDFVFSQPGCKLILVGDPDQLPPVGSANAPALDVELLRSYGLTVGRVWLTDVVRQGADSQILANASRLRGVIDSEIVPLELPELSAPQDSDVEMVTSEYLLEKLEAAFAEYGQRETVVITRSNKWATKYSLGIRAQTLYIEERLTRGDLLIVTRNNYLWAEKSKTGIGFIANGDIAEVVSINGYEEMYGLTFANVSLRFVDHNVEVDCKIIVDLLSIDAEPNSDTQRTARSIIAGLETDVASDYADVSNQKARQQAMRKDEYLNALQVRYAYALTCHKAQGGQWDAVFVDVGFYDLEAEGLSFVKWLYTAVTRAKKKLYMVNYGRKNL